MPIPDECAELTLLADADCDPFTMVNALRRGILRFSRPGRLLRIARPVLGTDFNDMLTDGADGRN